MADLKTGVQIPDTDCPICYECLSNTARTLSCSHTFCHDCLVRTLVSTYKDGVITRESIICPICRHLTFIAKQNSNSMTDKSRQILEVPLADVQHSLSGELVDASHNYENFGGFRCFGRIAHCLMTPSWLTPKKKSSEIFIISEFGRPVKEDDFMILPMMTLRPSARRTTRFRVCTTGRCLLVLLSLFSLLALITVTLPWILLA